MGDGESLCERAACVNWALMLKRRAVFGKGGLCPMGLDVKRMVLSIAMTQAPLRIFKHIHDLP